MEMERKNPDSQQQHWQNTFSENPDLFGNHPSDPARKAAELFQREGKTRVLELGCGQGRDTIYFARNGFHVDALDYSVTGIEAVDRKAAALALSHEIVARTHDIRQPLPFGEETFDACYSHMLFCMALTTAQLQCLSEEIRRVLQRDGLCIYTVRHFGDAHYQKGMHRGEDMYEVDGFIVHFFNRDKVKMLAEGYDIVAIDEFDEGLLPRKLFRVTLRKAQERS
jgi:SAM-dependent methyltransferase